MADKFRTACDAAVSQRSSGFPLAVRCVSTPLPAGISVNYASET
jgi:hypothetical protein